MVIIAAPHKTGSTTIQRNLVHYLSNKSEICGMENWEWPIPSNVTMFDDSKGFAALVNSADFLHLDDCEHQRRVKYSANSNYTCMETIEKFSRLFQLKWDEGKDIIWSHEGLDRSSNPLKKIMKYLPSGSYRHIIVVVSIRIPHIAHLISWLGEVNRFSQQEAGTSTCYSFPEMILNNEVELFLNGTEIMSEIDSLGQIYRYLKMGLKVVALDLNGIKERNFDVSKVIACDVMGIPCHNNKTFVSNDTPEIVANMFGKRGGDFCPIDMGMNWTQSKYDTVEKLLHRRDCAYVSVWDDSKLSLLYPSRPLQEMIQFCKHHHSSLFQLSHSEAIKQIKLLFKVGSEPNIY